MVEFGKLMFQSIMEFVGCMILGTLVSVIRTTDLQWVLGGFICWIPYMICWKISNAHLNPAVSLVCMLRRDYKDFGIVHFIFYTLAQLSGFLLSNFWVWWFERGVGSLLIWDRENNSQFSEAIGMETVGSFVFVLYHTLQLSKSCSLSSNIGLNAFTVGTFYAALMYWGRDVSGGSFNPAYGAAKNFIDAMDTEEDHSIEYIWIYVVFPILAALVVWPFYEFIYAKAYNDQENKQTEVVKATEL